MKLGEKHRAILRAYLCVFLMVNQCLRQLIGAGCRFESTTDPRKTFDGILYRHTDKKSRNALGIARTTANKFY